ncbi:arsenate-mycothiol transferase ArsC [Natronorubrum texcoconense]|uniref:Protein-tyrosine-phosphatase n=1 Tax=Natronorubrum texcoconense TaxID=1095776 RepID=A0A1G9DCE0_9EURY|nr:low molecular weight phosphatase family protein [Natronorubrum texcoconense]SDK61503.1 Protein-tyrosine-phosphatase [Natronorubrum texcoconense]
MTIKLAFVCVGNAGRSQMATAFAERERDQRNVDMEIVTGGTDPAEHIHEEVIDVLREEGIDISDRTPREISPDDIRDVDYVITMGCSVDQFRPENWNGEAETWELPHPEGDDLEATRTQRDEIKRRVSEFFDQLET